MSDDSDLIKLYSQRILALAADIPHLGTLEQPTGSAKKRSPLCGSTVKVDMVVRDGHVADYAQDVKACALGQASAAVVGANILGATREQIETARNQLKAMLKEGGPAPSAPFDGLDDLMRARDYKNRDASILLTLDPALAAFDDSTVTA